MKPQRKLKLTGLEVPAELVADELAEPAPAPPDANATTEHELREALLFIEAEKNSDAVYPHWGLNE